MLNLMMGQHFTSQLFDWKFEIAKVLIKNGADVNAAEDIFDGTSLRS